MRTGVVKIGGASLFSKEDDFENVKSFLRPLIHDSHNRWFIIVGGGDTVESMRTLHRDHPELDARRMHWRCVELLQATCDVAQELFGIDSRIDTGDSLTDALSSEKPGCHLVDVVSYYHPSFLKSIPRSWVPKEGWETTSDTLAWLLAKIVRADEVLLLKRPDCSDIASVEQASELGIIDEQLSVLMVGIDDTRHPDLSLVFYRDGWQKNSLSVDQSR